MKTIEERIAELEATPRALVGSDEGTHSEPLNHRLYEEITGERYAVASFANSNGSRINVDEAHDDTKGSIRYFPVATAEIREKANELRELRKQVKCSHNWLSGYCDLCGAVKPV